VRASILFVACALLMGCDGPVTNDTGSKAGKSSQVGSALDQKAVAVGILPDPENLVFSGRYETRSDLGTDKFCAVHTGADLFQIGVLAVFGPESKCEGQGRASITGENVKITLSGKKNCSFNATFDGIELRFPGALESGCESYCSPRASFSGTSYFIVEQGDNNAQRTLGRDFEKLCAD
jgi:hypothetical protein